MGGVTQRPVAKASGEVGENRTLAELEAVNDLEGRHGGDDAREILDLGVVGKSANVIFRGVAWTLNTSSRSSAISTVGG